MSEAGVENYTVSKSSWQSHLILLAFWNSLAGEVDAGIYLGMCVSGFKLTGYFQYFTNRHILGENGNWSGVPAVILFDQFPKNAIFCLILPTVLIESMEPCRKHGTM